MDRVWEKTLENPLDLKENKSVHPKGNQHWLSIGRTDAEAETPILCPPDEKSWVIGKDPEAGKDWGQKEKRAADSVDVNLSKLQEMVRYREAWRIAVRGVTKSQTRFSDGTTNRSVCHNNISQTGQLEIMAICFVNFWRLEVQDQAAKMVSFWWEFSSWL